MMKKWKKNKWCFTCFLFFQEVIFQENLLLGEYDVCLSNVDILYQVGDKKRRLLPGKNVSERVKGLHVVCKVCIKC